VRPGLRPTAIASLVAAAAVAGFLGWWFIRTNYGNLPDLNWLPGLTLTGLAVVESVAAQNTRAKVERRAGSGRINPLLVARYAVLAKASSLGGAIFAGAYGGIAVWAISERSFLRAAEANVAPAIAGLVGAVALTVAGLFLERSCRVPPSEDEENDQGAPPSGHR
jgi:hypothetical protein